MKLLQSSIAIEEDITYTSTRRQPITKIISIKKKKAVKKMSLSHEKHNNVNSVVASMSLQQPSGRYRYAIFLTSSLKHIIIRNLLLVHER